MILSRVLRLSDFLRIYSTPIPHYLCMLDCTYSFVLSHTVRKTSLEVSLSYIPSPIGVRVGLGLGVGILLARIMKSCSSVILNDFISGWQITTLGLPPNFSSFASMSPNVRETDSRPGKTLKGPRINSTFDVSFF